MHESPEPAPALDPHHPIVFHRAFVRRAGRIQWALFFAGGPVLLGAGFGALANFFVWGSIGITEGYTAACGALLILGSVIWGRQWRRHLRRAWWGELYGRWW